MKKMSFLLCFCVVSASCQDFGNMEFVADLPGLVKEVSGIAKFPGDSILWTINDSRNPPEIYGFDLVSQKMVQTIRLKNASNIDWEDLTTSPEGMLYVGDFGNNMSMREELVIYHVEHPGMLDKRRYEPKTTTFFYEDQVEFLPKKKDISFDVEAFIYLEDHFYLFTRNRAKKFDGNSKLYRVPAVEGHHRAKFMGSFKTCEDPKDCLVTGAAIHHDSGKVALLTYNKVWIFSDYEGADFGGGKVQKLKLDHSSQKESICFITEDLLYIADERSHGSGGNVYSLNLNELQANTKTE